MLSLIKLLLAKCKKNMYETQKVRDNLGKKGKKKHEGNCLCYMRPR